MSVKSWLLTYQREKKRVSTAAWNARLRIPLVCAVSSLACTHVGSYISLCACVKRSGSVQLTNHIDSGDADLGGLGGGDMPCAPCSAAASPADSALLYLL